MTPIANEHTVKRYDDELERLRNLVFEMGAIVLEQTRNAVRALDQRDVEAARDLISRDHVVNGLDVMAESVTVNLIALRQPMGSDLRQILALSKSASELERVGDEAEKIARMTIKLFRNDGGSPPSGTLFRDVKTTAALASQMLQGALDCLRYNDVERALDVVRGDRELDGEFQSSLRRLTTYVMDDHRNLGHVVDVVFVLKALERIGDHGKCIAEYVVYLVKGRNVRHVSPESVSEEELDRD